MASNQGTSSPMPRANKRIDYYPLWRHVTKVSRIPGGGSWEWICNLCPVRWWICHGANGVHLQSLAICILSQVASCFIHSVKRNRLGSQKAEDLVYVHSNLRLASRRGPEYNSGPSKEWDVDAENPDLDLSLAALNIEEPP
jgi:hypothetical protein